MLQLINKIFSKLIFSLEFNKLAQTNKNYNGDLIGNISFTYNLFVQLIKTVKEKNLFIRLRRI